jgi:hypothetical protein
LRKYVGEHEMVEVATDEERASGVTLSDGSEWGFDHRMNCSVPASERDRAYQWLQDNGFGGLLKRSLTVSFGKESEERAKYIRGMVRALFPEYEIAIKIGTAPAQLPQAIRTIMDEAGLEIELEDSLELPGATLRSFVTKQLKLGRPLPEFFGVYAPLLPLQLRSVPNAAAMEMADAES